MQNNIALEIKNVSKLYRLGVISTGTLSHDLNRWWHRVRGKEDPYQKIAEVNIQSKKGKSNYVWALKEISFDVHHGEVIGIIGKNGAGKSTLLKILSRVTSLTKGEIRINGRIASLLEVGTGFHPELTGKENIFLNGAILGMKRFEIQKKLDEIIAFSGVDKYVDTPVKRYSSGMRVRLAFAVAAHLEPEILVVDEVLAVGDAEFQKKAIGKMQEVSQKQGRTILFVSHNMAAVKNLCSKGILLENGKVSLNGEVNMVVDKYISSREITHQTSFFNKAENIKSVSIKSFKILSEIITGKPLEFEVEITSETRLNVQFAVGFRLIDSTPVLQVYSGHVGENFILRKKSNKIFGRVEHLPLTSGIYEVNLWLGSGNLQYDFHPGAFKVFVKEGPIRKAGPISPKMGYPIICDAEWKSIE